VLNRHAAKRVVNALASQSEVAKSTLDAIEEAVLRTDIHGAITYLNRRAKILTGWHLEEAMGRPIADVVRITEGGSTPPVGETLDSFENDLETPLPITKSSACILIRRDGVELGIEKTATPIHDQDGVLTGSVVAFHDLSAERARVSQRAQHDPLTGLPNRVLLNDRLIQAVSLAIRQDKQLAVMFIDLDQFKRINDSLGHDLGDKLLQSIASRLVSCVRRTDTVSRLGGDEFVVLLSQVEHEEDAAMSARKILRALAAPHIVDYKNLDISASIGVSTYPSDGPDAENLVNKADTAMYEAKKRGRNNYQFFRKDMQIRIAERQLLERDLRCALGRNEFLLHYQPKFHLQTGQITGMEALIRWLHPKRGLVPPGDFIPIAEECGLILPIGRWVRLEACRQAQAWRESGIGIVPMAVNVSAAEFEEKDFISGVRAVLIATGVDPRNLELELTESVLMHNPESTVSTLGALKDMGVTLAVDDFGTGYSSFTYLRRFSVDALKLDQSFVRDVTGDPDDATIVCAMIGIGTSLKLRVIAEGVETREQFLFLKSHSCAEGQGYYFSRPVVAEQAGRMIEAGIRPG
jgi:diguanylate cyclase (GGDEF)-like protein/PAS domain S-box-containing protein